MTQKQPITVAHGDGIGPIIMEVVLELLKEAGAQLDIETIEIGEKVYLKGNSAGIEESAWDSLRRTKVFLKAPITTPQGGGFKSLNVTTRKALGLYANIRPCVSYHPFVRTKHPKMDVVIVRENEEDLYAGVEHQQTVDVMQCLKLITRQGCERIIRYAFEYARANNRKKVTCFSKDNIMKMSDGLFHKVFNEIGEEYKDLEQEHWIVDIGAAKVADHPEVFDVIVMPNLYGDIISDVAAQITGSVGLGGSANIGAHYAMFEAIHGSAPKMEDKSKANPSGLLLGAIMMLIHIGQNEVAERLHNAWLKTIEEGIHTHDIWTEGISKQEVDAQGFGKAIIGRLGKSPDSLPCVTYSKSTGGKSLRELASPPAYSPPVYKKELIGVDVFIDYPEANPEKLAALLKPCVSKGLELTMISCRGMSVWPKRMEETLCTSHSQCRFIAKNPVMLTQIIDTLSKVQEAGLEFIKTENLYLFDGKEGFTRG